MNGINNFFSRFTSNINRETAAPLLRCHNGKVKTASLSIIGAFGLWHSSKQADCSSSLPSESSHSPLLEHAKLDARTDLKAFFEMIKNNTTFNENERIELAETALQIDPRETLKHIENFGIKDNKKLLKLCNDWSKITLENEFSTHFKNYLDSLKKLSRHQADAQNLIKIFETDPEGVYESLKNDYLDTQLISCPLLSFSFLRKLNLSDQNKLGEEVATLYPIHLPRFIFKSNLVSHMQEDLIKIAANQENETVSSSIFLYVADEFPPIAQKASDPVDPMGPHKPQGKIGKTDQGNVIKSHPGSFIISRSILNFVAIVITSLYQKDNQARISLEARIEIAKIAASQKGNSVSPCIKNYMITDQKALIEIATIALSTDPYGLMSNIHKYEIQNRQALLELAKKAASLHGEKVLNYLPNFGITTDSEVEEIKKAINKHSARWFF